MAAQVLWPASESLYDLMKLRATIGDAAFSSEKQGNPYDPSLCEWPDELFDWPGLWFSEWPATGWTVRALSLDPSKGKDAKHGDYSAYVLYGRDNKGVEYIEADLKRRQVTQIVADGVEHIREFKPDVFAPEANSFQELLCAEFERQIRAAGLEVLIRPIENTVNKQVRIRRLSVPLTRKQFRFKAKSVGTALLVKQLREFPLGTHDDGPDALEVARRVAIEITNGRQRARGPRERIVV